MSTREEILAALTDSPAGLTSKELAPKCPSAECDPLIVGGLIAQLRTEDVIHAAEEKRDGATVWVFGPAPKEEQPAHVSVPLRTDRDTPNNRITDAARAIAAMREPSTGRQAPVRATTPPATTPSPARPVDQPKPKEEDMDTRERVLKAVAKAGKDGLMGAAVTAICGTKYKALKLLKALIYDGAITKTGKRAGTKYFLPGVEAQRREAPAPRKPNGNGHGNGVYAAALDDLREKRAALVSEHAEQLAKLDRAIEAVGALA